MSRRGYLSCFISLAFALTVGLYAYRPSILLEGTMIFYFLAFAVNFLWNLLQPSEGEVGRNTLLYLTLGFALIAFFFAPRLGEYARDSFFRSQLPGLNRFIADVVPGDTWQPAPEFPALYRAHRNMDNILVVEFAWGGEPSPQPQTALIFVGDERTLQSPELSGTTISSKIADHWFYLKY